MAEAIFFATEVASRLVKRLLSAAGGLAWSALLSLAAQPGWTNSWVQGGVYERTGQALRPLPRAFVSVWSWDGELLGTTRTDGQGRYQFVDLPRGRLAVAASRPGYVSRQAAGRAGSRAILDCSSGCRQSGMDFELSRGAVLAGLVGDGVHEPVARATVSVRRVDALAASETPPAGATDDRGRFRIAGLRAGSYTLTVQRRAPDGRDEVLTKTLTVGEGEQILDLVLSLGSQESFRVAGRVSGIPFGDGHRTWVEIRPLAGSAAGSTRALRAGVGADGRFQFDSVPVGRYRSDAVAVRLGIVERTDYFLDVVDVLANTDGITLQPVEPATAAGTVEIAAGALPPGGVIRFTSRDGFGYRWTRVREADRRFELSGLRPGVYQVRADSTKFYVKGVKTGGEIGSPDAVILSTGMNRLTVVVAADHSRVFGMVRARQSGQPLPHARVALSGDPGKYSVQADQAGRFLLGQVIPGEYRVCAWTDIAPERVDDEVSWEQAGCRSRIISIDPFSEVDISLRAAP